jgi:branched-chain amino acid transport system permease protein
MTYVFQQALNALQLGSIYALIALGYTMVYGILTMINFAHGDLFMVGAFFCFILAALLGLSFVPTLLFTMFGVACIGVLIERAAYKPLRQAPRVSAIITALGVGLFHPGPEPVSQADSPVHDKRHVDGWRRLLFDPPDPDHRALFALDDDS